MSYKIFLKHFLKRTFPKCARHSSSTSAFLPVPSDPLVVRKEAQALSHPHPCGLVLMGPHVASQLYWRQSWVFLDFLGSFKRLDFSTCPSTISSLAISSLHLLYSLNSSLSRKCATSSTTLYAGETGIKHQVPGGTSSWLRALTQKCREQQGPPAVCQWWEGAGVKDRVPNARPMATVSSGCSSLRVFFPSKPDQLQPSHLPHFSFASLFSSRAALPSSLAASTSSKSHLLVTVSQLPKLPCRLLWDKPSCSAISPQQPCISLAPTFPSTKWCLVNTHWVNA